MTEPGANDIQILAFLENTRYNSAHFTVWVDYLQTSIQSPLNGHTLAGVGAVCSDGCDEGVQLVFLLLQLLHQALDGPFGKRLALATLPMTHQAVHDAQAGIVAGGCAADGHFSCLFLLHSLRKTTGIGADSFTSSSELFTRRMKHNSTDAFFLEVA